ncbi:MAG: integrin alpha [Pleurocapsa sp.]
MAIFDLSNLDGINGFQISGLDLRGLLGDKVSKGGDINEDGFDDIIIGAIDAGNSGKAYVIFGKDTSFSDFSLSNLDGTNGFAISGINEQDLLGSSVSSLDFNNDGFSDLLIGARTADPNSINNAGEVYLIFGRENGFTGNLDLSQLNGDNGFTINGVNSGDLAGFSVSNAGDVNGDGVEDLIIGAHFADVESNNEAGKSYVIFGQENANFAPDFDLSTLDGTNGFVINGVSQKDFSGASVSSAGDINSDGIDDLIVGTNFANNKAGASYVIFGKNTSFDASLNLSELDGNDGFIINGLNSGDNFGISVSNLGDVNGDSIDDIIIGAPQATPGDRTKAGKAFVVFGSDAGFNSSLDLSELNGDNGFTINGVDIDDLLGIAVSDAGDVNRDHINDIIIGARNANTEAGESYVIYGTNDFSATLDLKNLNDNQGFVIAGKQAGGFSGASVSAAGDVNGDGFDDLLIGAPQVEVDGLENAGESYVVFGSPIGVPIDEFLLGDVNKDTLLNELDSVAISRVAVGLDSEFAAFPGVNPLSIADMNGNGEISAFDAYLVL